MPLQGNLVRTLISWKICRNFHLSCPGTSFTSQVGETCIVLYRTSQNKRKEHLKLRWTCLPLCCQGKKLLHITKLFTLNIEIPMRFACCKMVLLPDVRKISIGHYRLCRHDFIATMSAILWQTYTHHLQSVHFYPINMIRGVTKFALKLLPLVNT